MNAQEKASELVLGFLPYMYCYIGSGMLINDYDGGVALNFARKCATISVDEVLKALGVPPIENKGSKLYDSQIDYWQQVRVLIESVERPKESDLLV